MKRLLLDIYNLLEALVCFLENNLPNKFLDNEEFKNIKNLRGNLNRSINNYLDNE